jgi:Sigma-70, region 4
VSHQDPMKFKPTETEIANERDDVASILELIADGKKYREIAEIESIPVGTVKSRINRARTRIMAARGAAFETASQERTGTDLAVQAGAVEISMRALSAMALNKREGLPMGDPATAMDERIKRRQNTNNLDL